MLAPIFPPNGDVGSVKIWLSASLEWSQNLILCPYFPPQTYELLWNYPYKREPTTIIIVLIQKRGKCSHTQISHRVKRVFEAQSIENSRKQPQITFFIPALGINRVLVPRDQQNMLSRTQPKTRLIVVIRWLSIATIVKKVIFSKAPLIFMFFLTFACHRKYQNPLGDSKSFSGHLSGSLGRKKAVSARLRPPKAQLNSAISLNAETWQHISPCSWHRLSPTCAVVDL